jgi:hypothetical protein
MNTYDEDFSSDMDARTLRGARVMTVGWTVRAAKSGVMWMPPQPFVRADRKAPSAKSVQYCPAAVEFDRRHFVIQCPFDLSLQFEKLPNGQVQLRDAAGDQSAVRPTALRELAVLHPQSEWRDPARPIIQIVAPYIFVADEPCYVVQTSPYLHYSQERLPGVQVCGRYPIHIWPRPLSWGFEWHDMARPLVLKRGAPWFYVHFETENPAGRVRLVEAEMTPELESYVNSIVDVSNYVNKTFSLFSEAQARRPAILLKPRKS